MEVIQIQAKIRKKMKKYFKNINVIIAMNSLMIILLLNGVHTQKCADTQLKKMIALLAMLLIAFVGIHSAFFVQKNLTGLLTVKCLKTGKQKIILKLKILNGFY